MKNYKLIALDMDGTLLNSQKKISPPTLAALKELLARGIYVVISTGRGLVELTDYRQEFKSMHFGVLISGGLVYDFFKEMPLKIHAVDEKTILQLIDFGLEERAMVHLHAVRKSLAREEDIQNMAAFDMEIYRDMFSRVCTRCNDFKAYVRENPGEVIKVNLYHRNKESRDRNLARMKKFDLTISFAEANNLEASPKNISKGSGLRELCEFLNIDLAETIAIGDAYNDLENLQTAGLPIAMGNAIDEVKKICRAVVADNDHDGVLEAIEKYLLR